MNEDNVLKDEDIVLGPVVSLSELVKESMQHLSPKEILNYTIPNKVLPVQDNVKFRDIKYKEEIVISRDRYDGSYFFECLDSPPPEESCYWCFDIDYLNSNPCHPDDGDSDAMKFWNTVNVYSDDIVYGLGRTSKEALDNYLIKLDSLYIMENK